jgi:hypothetical protein
MRPPTEAASFVSSNVGYWQIVLQKSQKALRPIFRKDETSDNRGSMQPQTHSWNYGESALISD